MSRKNQKRRRHQRIPRRGSPTLARSPFAFFVTRIGKQCVITTPAFQPSAWTRQTYDLIQEYQDTLARAGGDAARESAGAAFIVIASDMLELSLGPRATWEELDVEAVAERAGRDFKMPHAREQCAANLHAFAQFLAASGRLSGTGKAFA